MDDTVDSEEMRFLQDRDGKAKCDQRPRTSIKR